MAFSMQRLGAGDEYQLRFAGDLLNQEVRIQIDQFVKERRSGDPKFREIIFTRTQLLAAIKLIMLVCPRDRGVTLEEANVRLEFGEALLKLNDYLLDPSGDRWSEPVNLLTSESRVLRALINSFALEHSHDPLAYVGRFYWILIRYLPEIYEAHPRNSYQEIDAAFFRCFETTIADVFLVCFCIHIANTNIQLNDFGKKQPAFKRDEFFAKFEWEKSRLSKVLACISKELSDFDLSILAEQSTTFAYDLGAFRNSPICQFEDEYFLIDRQLILEQLGHQLYYRINRSLSPDRQQALCRSMGAAIEKYIGTLIEGHCQRNNLILSKCEGLFDNKQKGKSKHADFKISASHWSTVFEVTTAIQKESERFSGSQASIKTYFDRLTPELVQIVYSHIETATKSSSVKRNYGVLIGLDNVLSFWKVQSTLEPLYRQELVKVFGERGRDTILFPRLIVFSVADFEEILLVAQGGIELRDIFDAILAEDPNGEENIQAVMYKRGWRAVGILPEISESIDEIKGLLKNTCFINDLNSPEMSLA